MGYASVVKAKKSLGQHFLMHRSTAERIVAAAKLPPGAAVFEIGPGRGILTNVLLAQGHIVTAVEADRALARELRALFADEIARKKLTVVEGDAREYSLAELPRPYHVVANIPYYLTGELIRQLLESPYKPESMTLLVQKEVAERIARSKKESILSLSIKAYGIPTYAFTVPKGAFIPPPKVDSAVLSIREISAGRFSSSEQEKKFFSLVRGGFAHKRKFVVNNLKEAGFIVTTLPPKSRAEDLSLSDWTRLSQKVG